MPAIIANIIPMAFGRDNFSFKIKMLSSTATKGYKAVNETIILALYFCKATYHNIVPIKPIKVARIMYMHPFSILASIFGKK